MSNFTHLHTHSDYSFLDALPQVKELAKKAKEMEMTHLALTDRSNMHGAIEFFKACKDNDVKPVLGCEMFVAPRSRMDKEAGIDSKRTRIVLIAKNNKGYENLLQLVTIAYSEGFYYIPRIDRESLEKFSEDVFCILPRNGGEMTPYIETGDFEKSEKILEKFSGIFSPEFLFLETTPRPNAEGEEMFQKNFRIFCENQKQKISPVVSNDLRYLEKDESDVHDTLICMEYSLQKNESDRISFLEHDLSFWNEEQMRNYFDDVPEAVDNTQKIANQCQYEFTFGVNLIPQWNIPNNFNNDGELLKSMCEDGIRKRFGGTAKFPSLCDPNFQEKMEQFSAEDVKPITQEETNLGEEEFKEVTERLYFELETINQMGFNAYFLIVGDFTQWAKENGVAVGPGRGSAAGAIVAYLLAITDLNPLTYGLFFERFLNPERVSMPDIDIDFADNGRESVLEYTREKYGRDKVANVCTFGTMAARAAVKDVGRVLGVPFSDMNEFVKLIPDKPGTKLAEAEEEAQELKERLEEDEEMNKLFQTAKALEGNVRHVSVHACAVMITPEPILKYCPLQPAPKDPNTMITQFQAKPLEMLGLLKMDFLGLRNLTILENTLQNIYDNHPEVKRDSIDLNNIPMDDPKAFELLTEGLTTGVFQLESAGMTRYLVELKPSQFEDLIAMVSLYRPGPMKFIPDYIGGKHGTKKVKYPHPSLENILKETFGIAIYQEQILEIAKVFGGFTLGGADILRRAIGKKIQSELDAQREKFISGAQKLGHSEKLAAEIFDEVIVPFAGYGFNKSHAACYAMISYQTAYLKSRYPVEFMTALLKSDAENTDRVILDIEECRKLEIEVLPPSVLESDFSFSVINEKTIRFGLNAIKGIGENVVQGIIDARKESGGFENFADFLGKCGPKTINKKSLEALAKSGALIDLEKTENILANIEKILKFTKDNKEDAGNSGQDDLFGAFDVEIEVAELHLDPEPEYSLAQSLRLEKEVLGMYVSDHPLRGMKPYFESTGTPIKALPKKVRFSPEKKGKAQGLLSGLRKIITKKGDAMAVGQIEDVSGKLDIVLFPKSYAKCGDQLTADSFLKIEGKMDRREGEWQMMVDKAESFELEEIRKEAEEKGLLEENPSSFIDTEGLVQNENFSGEMEGEDISAENNQIDTWTIEIPENIQAKKILELKNFLKEQVGGKTEVIFLYKGATLPCSAPINKTGEVEKRVEEILGEE
jgi:DNA polymerase-3 subunit alpha